MTIVDTDHLLDLDSLAVRDVAATRAPGSCSRSSSIVPADRSSRSLDRGDRQDGHATPVARAYQGRALRLRGYSGPRRPTGRSGAPVPGPVPGASVLHRRNPITARLRRRAQGDFPTSCRCASGSPAPWRSRCTARRADLSRRVRIVELLPFAFREFLEFAGARRWSHCRSPRRWALKSRQRTCVVRSASPEYLSGGLYPFMLEAGGGLDLFGNVAEKVIRGDLQAHDPNLTGADLANIEQLLKFVGRSPIDGINYTSLARNLGDHQVQGGTVRRCPGTRPSCCGRRSPREPTSCASRRYSWSPLSLLYRSYEDCIGGLREDFFALAMAQHGMPFRYAKSTRGAKTPDFLVALDGRDHVIEVGAAARDAPSSRADLRPQGGCCSMATTKPPPRATVSRCTASVSPDGSARASLAGGSRGPAPIPADLLRKSATNRSISRSNTPLHAQ